MRGCCSGAAIVSKRGGGCGRVRSLLECAGESGAAKRPGAKRKRNVKEEELEAYDVTDPGRRRLRPAPGRSPSHEPPALSQRLLARPGDDTRHDRPGVAVLSDQFADLRAAGLAAGARQARLKPG